ncbi:MAG TPA: alpha/beta hydrolase [Ohtaekwangia sp.]|uniref:RBBP9/YdeN family alpha/beta hydrolase n=1 Tax=Ohtaekwangia sp. TaxID=2066019 RepID=UPI002F94529D
MASYTFKSTILILPGLGNSGDGHWQTLWEQQYDFIRVNQKDWDTPVCEDWIETIDKKIASLNTTDVLLVGHSLACCTIAFWAKRYNRVIKGALLVAPSDTEAETYPPGTSGFTPMPLNKLPFRSITVASTNDYYVTSERAQHFANTWGSELVYIGPAGHINVAAGFGHWPEGIELLKQLDQ